MVVCMYVIVRIPHCQRNAPQRDGQFCKAHGGGKRCQYPEGCDKSADGRTMFCVAHGGGKPCQFLDGCDKSARGSTKFCIAHGGGKRCQYPEGCDTKAPHGTDICNDILLSSIKTAQSRNTHRSRVDDGAPTLGFHDFSHRLHHNEGACDVDVHHPLEILERIFCAWDCMRKRRGDQLDRYWFVAHIVRRVQFR
jgi:hypothetical protein